MTARHPRGARAFAQYPVRRGRPLGDVRIDASTSSWVTTSSTCSSRRCGLRRALSSRGHVAAFHQRTAAANAVVAFRRRHPTRCAAPCQPRPARAWSSTPARRRAASCPPAATPSRRRHSGPGGRRPRAPRNRPVLPADPRDAALGLRVSETLGMTWEDVDLDAGHVHMHPPSAPRRLCGCNRRRPTPTPTSPFPPWPPRRWPSSAAPRSWRPRRRARAVPPGRALRSRVAARRRHAVQDGPSRCAGPPLASSRATARLRRS
jgi:integrase